MTRIISFRANDDDEAIIDAFKSEQVTISVVTDASVIRHALKMLSQKNMANPKGNIEVSRGTVDIDSAPQVFVPPKEVAGVRVNDAMASFLEENPVKKVELPPQHAAPGMMTTQDGVDQDFNSDAVIERD